MFERQIVRVRHGRLATFNTKPGPWTACRCASTCSSSKSQPMRQTMGAAGFHLGARACSIGLEVFVEEAGELFRRGVVSGFYRPSFRADAGSPLARQGRR